MNEEVFGIKIKYQLITRKFPFIYSVWDIYKLGKLLQELVWDAHTSWRDPRAVTQLTQINHVIMVFTIVFVREMFRKHCGGFFDDFCNKIPNINSKGTEVESKHCRLSMPFESNSIKDKLKMQIMLGIWQL